MANPPYSSSPSFSPPSWSGNRDQNTASDKNDGAFDASSAIIPLSRHQRDKDVKVASFSLAVVGMLSVLVVMLATAPLCNGGVFFPIGSNAKNLRGFSEDWYVIRASDTTLHPVVVPTHRSPRRVIETNETMNVAAESIDSGICDLDYCKANFQETMCAVAEEQKSTLASIPMAVQILVLLVLLSFSALFSGLTLGLMSLDLTGLEIVMAGDDPEAAKFAKKIYPVRQRGNLLLCTLLLGNTAVNSLMSIFSAEIFNGTVGFVTSTFLILIFGEIIPQALVRSVTQIFEF